MKKIFFALAALVLAFTGCSQEEDAIQVSEKSPIKVVVNMDKPGFGEDTRVPRQGWEANDVVIVVLDGKSNAYLKLTYTGNNETPWETAYYWYVGVDGDYAKQTEWQTIPSTGTAKATYFSSRIRGVYYNAEYVSITTDASLFKQGECVMTCEDGTYSFADGVLTLNITMIPQVAQFTIRGLTAGENGKLSDGDEVGVDNLIAYSGGTITSSGITLNQVDDAGDYNACWVHPNTDGINPVGISIYAAVDSEYVPDSKDFIQFRIYDGINYLCRNFETYATYKAKVTNGAAIIMNGPADEFGGNGWMSYY